MKEVWKDIKGYEGLYQVSNFGNVKSFDRYETNGKSVILYRGKKLKKTVCKTGNGYYKVTLCKKGKNKNYYVHRLVAETFLENPYNFLQINHKDENTLNNCVNNLEFCSCKYNINYGTRNERANKTKSKPIIQMNKNNKTIKVWQSVDEAKKFYNNSNISSVLTGKRKSASGYMWKYLKKEEELCF